MADRLPGSERESASWLCRFNELDSSHIRLKNTRYPDGAVPLLVILQHSHQGPAHRKTGSIQGVDQLGSACSLSLEPDARPPGLEVLKVAAGRNLPVELLAREPDLQIIGLGRRKTEVAGTKSDDTIR